MTRPIAVLRPEPGNAATASRIEAAGLVAIRLPLFDVGACAWAAPDPAGYDALLLTSANAVRHAGYELAALAGLPVLAVGAVTACAAHEAGLTVKLTGSAGAHALLAQAQAIGIAHALHLAGRERIASSPIVARTITVYASDPIEPGPAAIRSLAGAVAMLHSPRAAMRFAELLDIHGADRAAIRIAALSDAATSAAGTGWDRIATAAVPTDTALLDTARGLAG